MQSPKDFSVVDVNLSYMKKRGEKSMIVRYPPKKKGLFNKIEPIKLKLPGLIKN